MSEFKMSDILGSKLKVDGHRAAVLLDGEVIAKCASKSIAIELASKVNHHGKLTAENKRLIVLLKQVSKLRGCDMGDAANWLIDNTDDILEALSQEGE